MSSEFRFGEVYIYVYMFGEAYIYIYLCRYFYIYIIVIVMKIAQILRITLSIFDSEWHRFLCWIYSKKILNLQTDHLGGFLLKPERFLKVFTKNQ